jgi:hypothetical protein
VSDVLTSPQGIVAVVALIAAAAAPFLAGALEAALQSRLRRTTEIAIAQALAGMRAASSPDGPTAKRSKSEGREG